MSPIASRDRKSPSSDPAVLPSPLPEITRRPALANGRYVVEATLKPELPDVDGARALELLRAAGVFTAHRVRVGKLYELRGALNLSHAQTAARELLCDCVTQDFRILSSAAPSSNGGNAWRVEVWLKSTLADSRGESAAHALLELGVPQPLAVRCGLAYHISGRCGCVQLEKAVNRLLANPALHSFSVREDS